MYSKAIILRFENAGIFPKKWKNKNMKVSRSNGSNKLLRTKKQWDMKVSRSNDDRVFNGSNKSLRTKKQWIEQNVGTFHYSFIANVIRVLIGQRPFAKYRKTCVIKNANCPIENIAKQSYVKIENAFYKNKNGEEKYFTEKITIRKCLDNSWSIAHPSWIRFKYLLPEELYSELVLVANNICNCKAENNLFEEIADLLCNSKDQRVLDLINKAKQNKCEPLAKLLSGKKVHSLHQAGYKGLGPYLKTLVVKGVSDIIRLDGYICIPVSNGEFELFRNGSGIATIFDGGMVRIENVCDLEYTTLEIITSDYQKVQQ